MIKRGDIFYADLSPVIGSEQGGVRPVVVVQNDIGNKYSPTIIIAAITSQLNKAKLPTHVNVKAKDVPLPKNSVILLEQLRTIDKKRLRCNCSYYYCRRIFVSNVILNNNYGPYSSLF